MGLVTSLLIFDVTRQRSIFEGQVKLFVVSS